MPERYGIMNDAHWHLVVNHLPIVFPLAGLLVMVIGLVFHSKAVQRTAFVLFAFAAVAALAAMLTGEGAEEVVENLVASAEPYMERHEEKAEFFALLCYVLGGISLLGLGLSWTSKRVSKAFSVGTALFALVVLYFAKDTGTSGGEIRHTEIRMESNIDVGMQQPYSRDDDD